MSLQTKILIGILIIAASVSVALFAINPDFIKGAVLQKKTEKIINVIPPDCLKKVIIPVNLGGTTDAFNKLYDAILNGSCANLTYQVSLILPLDNAVPYSLICSKSEMGVSWHLRPDRRALACTKTIGNTTYQAILYNEGDIPGASASFSIFYANPNDNFYSNNPATNKYYVRTGGNFEAYKIERVEDNTTYQVFL